MKAIHDTLIIAGAGMPLGGLFGVLVGYLVTRRRFPGSRAMEMVSMINYALPGTIVGIAYLVAFNDPPLALTGTALIIVACYIFRYSPTGIRTTVALLHESTPASGRLRRAWERGRDHLQAITRRSLRARLLAGLGVVFIRSMTAIQRDHLPRVDQLDAHHRAHSRER